MTVLVSAIMSRVRTQLIDLGLAGPLRWSDTELQQWITDGQRTIIAAQPRASATIGIVDLQPGTRQVIPAGGYCYLTAYRNMGANGTTPGPAFEHVPRSLMDTQYPNWHSAAQVAASNIVVFDPSDPTAFYVSPPSDGSGTIEVNYSQNAPDISSDSAPLVVLDIYQTPLFDYTMWRASQKDSDYSAGQAVAAGYQNSFEMFLKVLMTDQMTLDSQGAKT